MASPDAAAAAERAGEVLPNMQDEMNWRFSGLSGEHFAAEGVHIFATAPLKAPLGFEKCFTAFHSISCKVSDEETAIMLTAGAILIVCDPSDGEQRTAMVRLASEMAELGLDLPPMLVLTLIMKPQSQAVSAQSALEESEFTLKIINLGIDSLIHERLHGIRLVLAVKAGIHRAQKHRQLIQNVCQTQERRAYLTAGIESTLWEYIPARIVRSIPPIDRQLAPDEFSALGPFTLGPEIGRGAFASVRKLSLTDKPDEKCSQVVKVLSKKRLTEFYDIKRLGTTIDIMRMLSSQEFSHPGLVQLYAVIHSPTHIYFRMEDAGPENLFRRLCSRQKRGGAQRPMSLSMVHSLAVQMIMAIEHLHMKARVCHRDIKPDNFPIREDKDKETAVLKLADFDFALQYMGPGPDQMCHNACGTIPFCAPEVLLKEKYDGRLADVWSLGIVLMELHCGVRIIERAFRLPAPGTVTGNPEKQIAETIGLGLGTSGTAARMVRECVRAELMHLVPATENLIASMLMVDPLKRLRSQQLWEAGLTLSQSANVEEM